MNITLDPSLFLKLAESGMPIMTLRRRIGELLGYSVQLVDDNYVLFRPDMTRVWESTEFPNSTPDEAFDFLPAFDTWDGIGLVLEWLMKNRKFDLKLDSTRVRFNDDLYVVGIRENIPQFICEQVLKEGSV